MFIKGSTKRGQNLIAGARFSQGFYLDEVYGRASSEKCKAWRFCKNLCDKMDGENFRITSHTAQFFTVAWECVTEYVDEKTGEVTQERITFIDTGRTVYMVLLDK